MGREIGKLLKRLRQQRGLTQRQLAAQVDIHYTYLSKLENGKAADTPKTSTLVAMADALEVDRDWLLIQCGRPPEEFDQLMADDPDYVMDLVRRDPDQRGQDRRYRLLGQVVAGMPAETVEHAEPFELANWFAPNEHFLLRVRGDSMIEDAICDGDLAIVRPQKECQRGQVVVAMVDGDEATLKRFYQDGPRVRLQPANQSMQPIVVDAERVQICGIVVGVIRNLS